MDFRELNAAMAKLKKANSAGDELLKLEASSLVLDLVLRLKYECIKARLKKLELQAGLKK